MYVSIWCTSCLAGNLFRMASLGAAGSAGATRFASTADLLGGVVGGPTGVGAAVAAVAGAAPAVAAAAGVVVGAAPDVVDVEGDAPMEVPTQGMLVVKPG